MDVNNTSFIQITKCGKKLKVIAIPRENAYSDNAPTAANRIDFGGNGYLKEIHLFSIIMVEDVNAVPSQNYSFDIDITVNFELGEYTGPIIYDTDRIHGRTNIDDSLSLPWGDYAVRVIADNQDYENTTYTMNDAMFGDGGGIRIGFAKYSFQYGGIIASMFCPSIPLIEPKTFAYYKTYDPSLQHGIIVSQCDPRTLPGFELPPDTPLSSVWDFNLNGWDDWKIPTENEAALISTASYFSSIKLNSNSMYIRKNKQIENYSMNHWGLSTQIPTLMLIRYF